MFDIGFFELLLVGIVALLVFGPERLPEVARTAGRWVAQIQRFIRTTKADIQRELDAAELKQLLNEQQRQISELQQLVGEVRDEVETDMAALQMTQTNFVAQEGASETNDANVKKE